MSFHELLPLDGEEARDSERRWNCNESIYRDGQAGERDSTIFSIPLASDIFIHHLVFFRRNSKVRPDEVSVNEFYVLQFPFNFGFPGEKGDDFFWKPRKRIWFWFWKGGVMLIRDGSIEEEMRYTTKSCSRSKETKGKEAIKLIVTE
ncbi:hypothetical protein Bca4012_019422 [Brassica carinata]